LKLSRRQIVILAVLFCIGVGCVGGYLIYNYNTSNQASWLTGSEISGYNEALTQYAQDKDIIQDNEVILINKVYKELGGDTSIDVVVYQLGDGEQASDWLGYRSGKLPKDAPLTQMGTGSAIFLKDNLTDIYNLTVQYNQ
jgi:hypothetical protein